MAEFYTDLHRHFIEVQENASDSSFDLDNRPDLEHWVNKLTWNELWQRRRVVILAEAGMGKTKELETQTEKLNHQGKFAFFCPIEVLAEEGLSNALMPLEEQRFEAWLQSDHDGYFFLDAVDEAKLVGKRLRTALRKLAKELGTTAERAVIVITSRISDWQPQTDLVTFEQALPPPPVASSPAEQPSSTQRHRRTTAPTELIQPNATTQTGKVIVVKLAPLVPEQQRQFAQAAGVVELDDFMAAIERADAHTFAERPQDLLDLSSYWQEYRRLGSFLEMHEFNIRMKLRERDPQRGRHFSLSEAQRREGVETLAAALTLCRKNTLAVLDEQLDTHWADQVLQVRDVLGWSDREITALLQLPIFDQQTYGRIRFHHRSIREYLAACWFKQLLESGAPFRAIEPLLFKEMYGEPVVIPSLRPIGAWLGLWDERVRSRLLAIAPEVLLEGGDPASLPLETRMSLLRQFAAHVVNHTHADSRISLAAAKRLADPDLAPVILELLDHHRHHETIRDLLLLLVWQGRIEACAEAALGITLDPTIDPYARVTGARAVAAAGNAEQKRRLAEAVLANSLDWEPRVLGQVVINLFPETLSVLELLGLVEQAPFQSHGAIGVGLPFALERIAAGTHSADDRVMLLSHFITLLDREPYIESSHLRISQQFAWLLSPLTQLVAVRLQTNESVNIDQELLHAIDAIGRGHQRGLLDYQAKQSFPAIADFVASDRTLNRALFWYSVQRNREAAKLRDAPLTSWPEAWHFGMMWTISEADFDGFVADMTSRSQLDDRLVALSAAFHIWRDYGLAPTRLLMLQEAVREQEALEARLSTLLNPPEEETRLLRAHEAENQRWQEEDRRAAHEQEQEEQAYVQSLQVNPQRLCNPTQIISEAVLRDLYHLVHQMTKAGSGSRWGHSNWETLVPTFGQQVAEAVRQGLQLFWRQYTPPLRSEGRNGQSTNGTIAGLCGLSIESQALHWAEALTSDEAVLAARYATNEMNGFPAWIEALLQIQTQPVTHVIARELEWHFQTPTSTQPDHILYKLAHGPESVREHFSPLVWQLLQTLEPHDTETANQALDILMKSNALDRLAFASLINVRCCETTDEERKLMWLVAWIFTDANSAIGMLQQWVQAGENQQEQDRRMLAFCNAMMSHYSLRFGSVWLDFDRVEPLSAILTMTFTYIRPGEDNVHEGVYSPDARDGAESTRSYLLECLCNKQGQAAFEALRSLASASLPLSEDYRERLHILAYRRAATDAEPEAWKAEAILKFADTFTRLPSTGAELFELVLNRFDDLWLDLQGSDFSNARLLRQTRLEKNVQVWFAEQLRSKAQKLYSVTREEEVIDQKKPDIRIHASAISSPVAIEIKVANNWSLSELCEGLENQLIKQYHRDERSQFGIYLLTYHETKSWRVAEQGSLDFSQLISYLQQLADDLSAQREDVERIRVIGIDLTQCP